MFITHLSSPQDSDPRVTLSSRHAPRASLTPWLTRSEHQDRARVLRDKVHYLARLVLASRRTVVCTGAVTRVYRCCNTGVQMCTGVQV